MTPTAEQVQESKTWFSSAGWESEDKSYRMGLVLDRYSCSLEAQLEEAKARCIKHEGHEHCVTPCDSIRIQESNHSAWQESQDENKRLHAILSECRCWKDEHCPLHSVGIAIARADSLENVLKAKINWDRAEKAESESARLRGELAAMTKEKEAYRQSYFEAERLCDHGRDLLTFARAEAASLKEQLSEARRDIAFVKFEELREELALVSEQRDRLAEKADTLKAEAARKDAALKEAVNRHRSECGCLSAPEVRIGCAFGIAYKSSLPPQDAVKPGQEA